MNKVKSDRQTRQYRGKFDLKAGAEETNSYKQEEKAVMFVLELEKQRYRSVTLVLSFSIIGISV